MAIIDKIMGSERVTGEYKKRLAKVIHKHGERDCSEVLDVLGKHMKDLGCKDHIFHDVEEDRLISVGCLSLNAAAYGLDAIKNLRDCLMESYPVFHRPPITSFEKPRVVFSSRHIFSSIELQYSSAIDVVVSNSCSMHYHRIKSASELFNIISDIESDIYRLERDCSNEWQEIRRENIFSFI